MTDTVKIRATSDRVWHRPADADATVRLKPGEVATVPRSFFEALAPGLAELASEPAKKASEQAKEKPKPAKRQAVLRKAAESVDGDITAEAVNANLPHGVEPFTKAEIKKLGF